MTLTMAIALSKIRDIHRYGRVVAYPQHTGVARYFREAPNGQLLPLEMSTATLRALCRAHLLYTTSDDYYPGRVFRLLEDGVL